MTTMFAPRAVLVRFAAVIAFILIAIAVAHATEFSPAEIARLPQEKVDIIKSYCAHRWPEEFDMRVFCEDKEYKALKTLIDRGSVEAER